MELFGFAVPAPVFWVAVVVIAIALLAVICIPIYQGYKKEMTKAAKKKGGSKGSSSKRR